jgi:hypothetical protein
MITMKTTHRLSLDASGVLNIVTTMTCNSSAPGTTSTAYKKGRSRVAQQRLRESARRRIRQERIWVMNHPSVRALSR